MKRKYRRTFYFIMTALLPYIFLNPADSGVKAFALMDVSPEALHLKPCGISGRESGTALPSPEGRGADTEESGKGLLIPEEVISYWRSAMPRTERTVPDKFPPAVDWSPYDSPVKSQGACGACAVFAAAALIENMVRQQYPGMNTDLSEQVILSCIPDMSCMGGWYYDVFSHIRSFGAVSEDCYPYAGRKGDCDLLCTYPDYLVKITDHSPALSLWGENHSADDLRRALQNGPLVVSMRVPNDGTFEGRGYRGGVYDYEGGPISWTDNAHAVLLVGYNDEEQSFRAKNSWGAQWGESGYFRIAYDDVSDDVKFGSYACAASGVLLIKRPALLRISNPGTEVLNVSRIRCNEDRVNISPDSDFRVFPDSFQTVIVSVPDWEAIPASGMQTDIRIRSDAFQNPSVTVSVTAERPPCSGGTELGNMDCSENGTVLKDAIITLQILTGNGSGELCYNYPESGADVNGDKRAGMEEVIYILRYVGGL